MDAKSLAKSKRAHSQKHRSKKPHPNPKSKSPLVVPTTEGNSKKPSLKQTKPCSRQVQDSSTGLPSNWDRYEYEFDSGSEDPSHITSSKKTSGGGGDDVVKPKSKGANFGYLISEAQSQSSPNLDGFTSFYDALPDFDKAVSSMLSVKGNNVLSWIGDDNFIVDDNAKPGYEATFLSMDLNALAAELEKTDISQRLFIDADLLPQEPCAGELNDAISQEPEQAEMGIGGYIKHQLAEFDFHGHNDVDKSTDHRTEVVIPTASRWFGSSQRHSPDIAFELVNQEREDTCSNSNSDENSVPVFLYGGQDLLNHSVKQDASKKLDDSDLSELLDSMKQPKDNAVPSFRDKTVKFEASAAEAELDILLDSLSEINLVDPSSTSKKPSVPLANPVDSTFFMDKTAAGNSSSQPFRQVSKSSNTVTTTFDIEDTIDDLLSGTSTMKNLDDSETRPKEKTRPVLPSDVPSLLSSSSLTNSKVLDDFDSWLDTF